MRKSGLSAGLGVLSLSHDHRDHLFCTYLRENFTTLPQDMKLITGPAEHSVAYPCNRVFIKMVSPMLRRCLEFRDNGKMEVDISQDVSMGTWQMIEKLILGDNVELGPNTTVTLLDIGKAAIFLQIECISIVVEEKLLQSLTLQTCAHMLMGALQTGMPSLEQAATKMALDDFFEFSKTDGFVNLSREALISLVANDKLPVCDEELVLDALVRWFDHQPSEFIALNITVFKHVRLMSLRSSKLALLALRSDLHAEVVDMIKEAAIYRLLPEDRRGEFNMQKLPIETTRPRRKTNAASFFENRATGKVIIEVPVTAMVVCSNLVCCGLRDGEIITFENVELGNDTKPVTKYAAHGTEISSMIAYDKNLVSCSSSSHFQLKVSDPASGRITAELAVPNKKILSMAKANVLLLVAMEHGDVIVFCAESPEPRLWAPVYNLKPAEGFCTVIQTYGNCVYAGTNTGSILFWDIESGDLMKKVEVSPDTKIVAVAKHKNRLLISTGFRQVHVRTWDDLHSLGEIRVSQSVQGLSVYNDFVLVTGKGTDQFYSINELHVEALHEDPSPWFTSFSKPIPCNTREDLFYVSSSTDIESFRNEAVIPPPPLVRLA